MRDAVIVAVSRHLSKWDISCILRSLLMYFEEAVLAVFESFEIWRSEMGSASSTFFQNTRDSASPFCFHSAAPLRSKILFVDILRTCFVSFEKNRYLKLFFTNEGYFLKLPKLLDF